MVRAMRALLLAVMLMCGLFASTAAAQEDGVPCGTGAAELGDRRALAAVAATIDAECPCPETPQRRSRIAHARCGRAAIATAVDAGTLRRECVRPARRALRQSTCGTNRVTCARVQDGAPASCRLAAPRGRHACGVRDGEQACAAETACEAVVDWTAGTCFDPRQRGPFNVGARIVRLVKDSVSSPGTERVLETVVWYPTSPEAAPVDPRYAAVLDAPLEASAGPYPLLLFSHGSCGYPAQSLFLTPLVASYGYVVAAPPHPGNTVFEFPACGTPPALATSFFERPDDMLFVLEALLAAATDPGSPFAGAIDAERLGMAGHSFGGLTTYLTVERDDRFRVALPLAAAVPGTPALTIPSLTMLGEVDSVVDNARIRSAYAAAAAPKLLVGIEDAGHYAFSDLCFPSPDCMPPVTLEQAEAHALVVRWVLPFLEHYLAGREAMGAFFDTPLPGTTVEAELD